MAGYKKKLYLITFFICSFCCLLSGYRCKQTLRVNAPSYPLRQIPSFHSLPLLSLSLPPFFSYLFFISSLFTLIATTTTTTAISTQSHAELNCQKQCTLSFLLKKESGPLSAPFPSLSPIISQRVESVVLLLVAITWADRRMSMADVEETALVRGRMELGPPHRRHWHHGLGARTVSSRRKRGLRYKALTLCLLPTRTPTARGFDWSRTGVCVCVHTVFVHLLILMCRRVSRHT